MGKKSRLAQVLYHNYGRLTSNGSVLDTNTFGGCFQTLGHVVEPWFAICVNYTFLLHTCT